MLMLERTQWGHIFFVVNNVLAKKLFRERLQIVQKIVILYINKNQAIWR